MKKFAIDLTYSTRIFENNNTGMSGGQG